MYQNYSIEKKGKFAELDSLVENKSLVLLTGFQFHNQ